MNRSWIVAVFALVACNQNKADPAATGPLPSNQALVVASAKTEAPATPVAPAQTSRFSGSFTAQAKKSGTTKKEGAPEAWEKDDGKAFSGDGKVTLTVDADGTVQGSLTGALGERALRGRLSGEELRAALVPTGSDVTQIQNGFLTLKREGNGFKGTLSAATGDALVLREAKVVVTPSAS